MATFDAAARERLLARLEPTIASLARAGRLRGYPRNAVIVHEGEAGDDTFVLLQGRVKVYSSDLDGREITYGVIEAGDYFADMWFDGQPRSASVMTLEDCICSVVPRAAMEDLLASMPALARLMLARMTARVRTATTKLRDLALKDVYGRVVSVLEGQRGPATVSEPVTLYPLTHQALASRVGSSREMVSRLLKDLERGGYVELGVKRITLKKKLPPRW
ncbi:Crp/Fnr family transcriptional regulator [Ramlibacter humi]|uniref:Crp/Fnr family transcriptional regulator n=1 Tax=Ramlibacter humi TaxID=2530451 RepID=A0A4Z0BHQ3_9BURK|nr:Crp/Fnr family transcriptional regulator [Ramlibacter humi]TFY98261.1 Crp/Fnr family transcriptional regulator [Ramlibacter humi]